MTAPYTSRDSPMSRTPPPSSDSAKSKRLGSPMKTSRLSTPESATTASVLASVRVSRTRHEQAEEVYVVLAGSGRVKLDDEIIG